MDYAKQWKKEFNRIQRFIKRAQGRGFIFPDLNLNMPKHPTQASVNKLKRMNPAYFYKKATYINPQTGEIMSGVQGRKSERSEAAIKAAQTRLNRAVAPPVQAIPDNAYKPTKADLIIAELRDFIDSIEPEPRYGDSQYIKDWMNGHKMLIHSLVSEQINIEGKQAFANRLQRLAEQGENIEDLIYDVIMSSKQEDYNVNLSRFLRILRGHSPTADELKEIEEINNNLSTWFSG